MDDTRESPPGVPGDAKDWTWVLERTCPECEVDVRHFDRRQTGRILRDVVRTWQSVLARPADQLRARPDPHSWSPLEYACHVSDVFDVYSKRLELMLSEDAPHYPDWDQDRTAVEQRYDLADPESVARKLGASGRRLAEQFDGVTGEQWSRSGFRSDGATFTVETFARYFIHDPVHHLHDVGNAFDLATADND